MYDLLPKITFLFTGTTAFWFSFIFVNQPLVPLYHNIFLFMVSWVLFYSFVDIAFQPITNPEKGPAESKRKKIRRKNNTHLEKV